MIPLGSLRMVATAKGATQAAALAFAISWVTTKRGDNGNRRTSTRHWPTSWAPLDLTVLVTRSGIDAAH